MNSEIGRMTFGQLRKELAYCNDPIKEKIIRHFMYLRYTQYVNKKRQLDEINRLRAQKAQKKKDPVNKPQEQIQVDDIASLDPDDFEVKPVAGSLNELEDELFDDRNVTEYERDVTNNNLVKRLNSDIDIRTMGGKKKEFLLPYSDDVGGNYAPFNSGTKVPKNDFSNDRLKKSR